jgi:hypothetical protein
MKKTPLFLVTLLSSTITLADNLWTDVYINSSGFLGFEFVQEGGVDKIFSMSKESINDVNLDITGVVHLENAIEPTKHSRDSHYSTVQIPHKELPILNNCIDKRGVEECIQLPVEISKHDHQQTKHPIILGINVIGGETGMFYRNIDIVKALIGSNRMCNNYKLSHPGIFQDIEFLIPFYDFYDGFITYKSINQPPYSAPVLHENHALTAFEFVDDVTFRCVVPHLTTLPVE